MSQRSGRPRSVREPLQVYLTSDERRILDHLALESGLSRAEVLRRGLRSFAKERSGAGSRMLELLDDLASGNWPAELARGHDEHLVRSYRGRRTEK